MLFKWLPFFERQPFLHAFVLIRGNTAFLATNARMSTNVWLVWGFRNINYFFTFINPLASRDFRHCIMKKLLLLSLAALPVIGWSQCTTTNATSCVCLDGTTECDLLPDITGSYDLLEETDETVETPGELRLSVGTPNIGHGPLRVVATDYYVCGGDTIYSPGGLTTCPDGSSPRQIIDQRIYHKNGSDMTYFDRQAGTMTYHPDHGHFHTDNWGNYTLRKPVDGVEDPTEWPIIGYGSKMGFCLMDLANCATPSNYGYCREDDGTVITNDIDNYGLGGGGYNCAITNQGISVGYLDIYDYYLDGMSITIPEGVCNGDYYIVVEIDPNNNYWEESDNNNVIAVPITLTEQPETIDYVAMTHTAGVELTTGVLTVCETETVELSVSPIGTAYTWSNGATTSSITVTEPGTYYCFIERECGDVYSDTLVVEMVSSSVPAIDPVPVVCSGETATLTASADGTVEWYTAAVGGSLLGTGEMFVTDPLFENTVFYAQNVQTILSAIDANVGQVNHEGSDYSTGTPYNGYEIFDALEDMTIESVKVYTDYPGVRIIELRDAAGIVLESASVDIPSGTTVIDLGFDVPAGSNYRLGTNDAQNTTTFGDLAPRLKRSTSGTAYPYTVDGLVTITNSSFDETRWYYFYDWHVTGNAVFNCPSERSAMEVEVKVCTGIGDVSNLNSLNIYPNPSTGVFTIDLNTPATNDLSVVVTNITGEMVFTSYVGKANGSVQIPVDLHNAASGMYMVKIVSEGNNITRTIVVE